MRFLGLDIGTTRIKCGVYSEGGKLLYSDGHDWGTGSRNPDFLDMETLYAHTEDLLRRAYAACPFDAFAISSLGESFVLLSEGDRVLVSPMLYTDSRGAEEAAACERWGEKIFGISGVFPQAMYSVYKLLWIKNRRPELYAQAKRLMLIGDYIGYRLTGVRGCDYASAARTGVFDVRGCEFSRELCDLFGIERSLFSPVIPSGTVIGEVRPELSRAWGAKKKSIRLVAGGHDQVCAALGAGAVEAGACADGMGTVECLTALFPAPSDDPTAGRCGYPNVPFPGGLTCTYLLNYSCGSLVRWWLGNFFSEEEIADGRAFAALEKDFPEKPTGLLVLPYFAGAATPYQNAAATGSIVGLRLSTTPADIYKAILEGLSLEMRLNLDTTAAFGVRPGRLIATGGGSASATWLQLKADVTGIPVYPLVSREAGVCGAAMLSAHALTGENLGVLATRFTQVGAPFLPRPEQKRIYDSIYERYRRLYPALREIGNR